MKINHVLVIATALAVSACSLAETEPISLILPKSATPTLTLAVPGIPVSSPADGTTTGDHAQIHILDALTYETASATQTTWEYGFGIFGLGGGINMYTNPEKTGLMWSARAGWWGAGFAVNGGIHYVGKFSDSVSWRVGLVVEYLSISEGVLGNANALFPWPELGIGFRL